MPGACQAGSAEGALPVGRGSAATAFRVHQRRHRSDLIAVPLGHSCSDKPFASFTAGARAMGGAPIRKCLRVDVNTHNDVSVGIESPFHFLCNLQPLFPGPWPPVAIVENFHQRRIIFLSAPIALTRSSY